MLKSLFTALQDSMDVVCSWHASEWATVLLGPTTWEPSGLHAARTSACCASEHDFYKHFLSTLGWLWRGEMQGAIRAEQPPCLVCVRSAPCYAQLWAGVCMYIIFFLFVVTQCSGKACKHLNKIRLWIWELGRSEPKHADGRENTSLRFGEMSCTSPASTAVGPCSLIQVCKANIAFGDTYVRENPHPCDVPLSPMGDAQCGPVKQSRAMVLLLTGCSRELEWSRFEPFVFHYTMLL